MNGLSVVHLLQGCLSKLSQRAMVLNWLATHSLSFWLQRNCSFTRISIIDQPQPIRITKLNRAQNCRPCTRDPMSKSQRLSLLLHNSRKAIDGGHLQQIGNLWVIVSRINLLQTDNSRSYDTSSNVTMFVGQPQYYKRILTRSIIMKIISSQY